MPTLKGPTVKKNEVPPDDGLVIFHRSPSDLFITLYAILHTIRIINSVMGRTYATLQTFFRLRCTDCEMFVAELLEISCYLCMQS